MSGNKTVPTNSSVSAFLNAIENPSQREDSIQLMEMMKEVTGEPAVMWGPGIIGFGSYHYVYESGREGDILKVGFSPRKGKLVLYVGALSNRNKPILQNLGKFVCGKSCLYIKRMGDIDKEVLRQIIRNTHQNISELYEH